MSKGKKKKHTGAIFTVTAVIALIMGGKALDFDFGLGFFGNGDDIGVESGNVSVEDGNDSTVVPEITPGVTPTDELVDDVITEAPEKLKVFDIIIDKDKIVYNKGTYASVDELIEVIFEEAGEDPFYIVLHDETAIENTLEDVKNFFDRNEIVWTTAD